MNKRLCLFTCLLSFGLIGQANAQFNVGGILKKPISKIINPIGDGGQKIIGGIKKSIEYAPGALIPGAKLPGKLLDGKGLGLAPGMKFPPFKNPGGQVPTFPGGPGQWIGGQPILPSPTLPSPVVTPMPYPQPQQTMPYISPAVQNQLVPVQGQAVPSQGYPVQNNVLPVQGYTVPQQNYSAQPQYYSAPAQTIPAQTYSVPSGQPTNIQYQYSQPSTTPRPMMQMPRPLQRMQQMRRSFGSPFRR